jgi:hypothetical protein
MAPGLPMPASPPAPRLHTQTDENQRYVTICLQYVTIFSHMLRQRKGMWWWRLEEELVGLVLGFGRSDGWRRADCDGGGHAHTNRLPR